MRFIVAFACLVSLFTFVPFHTASAQDDKPIVEKKKRIATAIRGFAKIDGEIDDAWSKTEPVKVDRSIKEMQSVKDDEVATATVRLMYDKRTLFALWEVTDGELSDESLDDWQQDSVELFLDRNNNRTKYYEGDDAQYRSNYRGDASGQGGGYDESDWNVVAKKTKTGYRVEMAVKVESMYLKPGAELGLELQVNNDPGNGQRGSVAKWNHTGDESWENTSVFGTLKLK